MKGLIYKDYLLIRRQYGWFILLIAAAYLLIALYSRGQEAAGLLYTITMIFSWMLLLYLFSADENAKWDRCALPALKDREILVRSRYAVTILILLSGNAYSLIGMILVAPLSQIAEGALLFLAAGLFGTAPLIPLLYRFGPVKTRWIFMLLVMGFSLCLPLFAESAAAKTPDVAVMLTASVLAQFVSYCLSVKIYKRKEID